MTEQQKQQKDNNGVLFTNKNKTKEKQPDYKGKAVVNGKTLRISGWENFVNTEDEKINLSFISEEEFLEQIEKYKKEQNESSTAEPSPEKQVKKDEEEDLYDPDIEEIFKDFF